MQVPTDIASFNRNVYARKSSYKSKTEFGTSADIPKFTRFTILDCGYDKTLLIMLICLNLIYLQLQKYYSRKPNPSKPDGTNRS